MEPSSIIFRLTPIEMHRNLCNLVELVIRARFVQLLFPTAEPRVQ